MFPNLGRDLFARFGPGLVELCLCAALGHRKDGEVDAVRPVLFHIGSYPVYSYGVMLFLTFLAGIMVARAELERRGLDSSAIYLIGAVAAISGVLGARLFYVMGHLEEFSGDWGRVIDFNMRGLVYYGGLALAVLSCLLLVRRLGLPAGDVADSVGLALPLSLAIARVGCFLNGCCGGKPSGLPWAVTLPGSLSPVHPTQIYEMLLDLALFAFLLMARKRLRRGWDLFFLSLAGYGLVRFMNEIFRFHADARAGLFFQAVSLALAAGAAGLLLYRERKAAKSCMSAMGGGGEKAQASAEPSTEER